MDEWMEITRQKEIKKHPVIYPFNYQEKKKNSCYSEEHETQRNEEESHLNEGALHRAFSSLRSY